MKIIKNVLFFCLLATMSGCNFDRYDAASKIYSMFSLIDQNEKEDVFAPKTNTSTIKAHTLLHSYLSKKGGNLLRDDSRVTGFVIDDSYEVKVIKDKTWVISNKLGTGFVLGVVFVGIPRTIKELDLKVTFPEMTLPSGVVKSEITRPISMGEHRGVYEWSFEYYFDETYETSPGIWAFEVSLNNEVIYEAEFTVVDEEKE